MDLGIRGWRRVGLGLCKVGGVGSRSPWILCSAVRTISEQAAMVRNSAGAGLRKQPNPGHFGRLRNPSRTHFCRSKKRTCLGKRGRMVTLIYCGIDLTSHPETHGSAEVL